VCATRKGFQGFQIIELAISKNHKPRRCKKLALFNWSRKNLRTMTLVIHGGERYVLCAGTERTSLFHTLEMLFEDLEMRGNDRCTALLRKTSSTQDWPSLLLQSVWWLFQCR
jgi:hypothetical protein